MSIHKDMREWLLECYSDEYDQEVINGLTDSELGSVINRYYDGGMRAFRADYAISAWSSVEA